MLVDLRSDTVTKPTFAMRRAMAEAEVGDDVYGEDPSVRALEEEAAGVLGKEAALYVPSGTMANQIAIRLHTRPGDRVLVGEHAHLVLYEVGALGVAGVQHDVVGHGGLFDAEELEARIGGGEWEPRARLVAIENTHNRAGGRVWDPGVARSIVELAHARGLAAHLDGARLWHAAIARSKSVAELAQGFDTATACFSKGLGAPVGSTIAGSRELIREARRIRRRLGGGMRQAGVIAAGALYALRHHRERLTEDHEHARALARGLAERGMVVETPETNIVLFAPRGSSSKAFAERAAEGGVLVVPFGPTRLRAVTHLDVAGPGIERAIEVLTSV